MTKKVLVTERLAEAGLAVLRDKGCEVDVKLKMTPEELIETVPGYDALIVRSATKVTAEVVEAADRLRIIGRAGVGVDNVDVEAATEHGIIVCNAPTSNIVSAAEHAIGLMLACARKVPQANASMHEMCIRDRTRTVGTNPSSESRRMLRAGGGRPERHLRAVRLERDGTQRTTSACSRGK